MATTYYRYNALTRVFSAEPLLAQGIAAVKELLSWTDGAGAGGDRRRAMKKAYRIMLLFLATAMCGCANIITRTDCDLWATAPYQCTCEVAEAIAAPFSRPSGPEGGIGQAICTMILPISIISLPFDAAIDTAFLPWDLYCRKEAK